MKKILLYFLGIVVFLLAISYFFKDKLLDYYLEKGYQTGFYSKALGQKLLHSAVIKLPLDIHSLDKPVILMLHGCGGKFNHQEFWSEKFFQLGFPSIIIDSYSIRKDLDKRSVCKGKSFFGPERSADVLSVISELKYIDSLKDRKIIIAGWSHGGWTAMESISMIHNQIPHSLLKDDYNVNIDMIVGSIMFYPYCGALSRLARYEWPKSFKSLMVLVENDKILDHKDCVNAIEGRGLNKIIDYSVIKNTHHSFDFPPGLEKYKLKNDPIATKKSFKLVENYLKSLDY